GLGVGGGLWGLVGRLRGGGGGRGWGPTPLAALLSIPPVLLYCGLVGWEVPATRAALMVFSYLLALMLQRSREPLHALVLAAALVLPLPPAAARDIAVRLSFCAGAAIFLVLHCSPLAAKP